MCRPAAPASTWWGPGGPRRPPPVRGRVGGEEITGVCVCVCVCVCACVRVFSVGFYVNGCVSVLMLMFHVMFSPV